MVAWSSSSSGPTRASTGCARCPYARAWHAKYETQGLTIVGVHTPEFGFERGRRQHHPRDARLRGRIPGRDRQRLRRLDRLRQPLLACHLHGRWPGTPPLPPLRRERVRDDRDGRPARSSTENGATGVDRDFVHVDPQGFEVAADWDTLRTPETYMSFGRSAGFASPAEQTVRRALPVPGPSRLGLNQWAPSGTWALGPAAATLTESNGRIAFRFQARDVNLVMGPATRGVPVPFRVLLDGAAAGRRRRASTWTPRARAPSSTSGSTN